MAFDPIIEKFYNPKDEMEHFSMTGAVLSIIGILFWINVCF